MMRFLSPLALALALGVSAPMAHAQTVTAEAAPGGVVRWLDKVSGATGDMELSRGQSGTVGRLTIQLDECRYPAGDAPTAAYAHLTILDRLASGPVFSGWMVADSPALSALDHSRYDVWVLRCLTE